MKHQEKENIQDDIEAIKAFGAYEDDLENKKQSPLEAFKDAIKGEKQRESQQLLDDFAKAAMQAIIGTMPHPQHPNWGGKEGAAYHAYEIATMMMKERERRMKG